MLNQYYADAISKRGGIGIADAVYSEILKMQHLDSGPHTGGKAAASVAAQTQSLINAQMQGQAASQELK
jgi:Rod binding domain-containing protein